MKTEHAHRHGINSPQWFLLLLLPCLLCFPWRLSAAAPPNIVCILADDLGYGDARCLNPAGKIPTPHLDRLAASGMTFTDAHSGSAVCTPTRYGLLTGRYNWRSRLKSGVMGGMSPPLIEPGRLTVAAFLQQAGYHTACVGKWHLGFDWPRRPDTAPFTDGIEKGADGWRVDFSKPIARGPNAFGFDYFFGLAASLDMVPYSFIENDRVTEVPTVDKAFPMMLGRTNSATRRGPAAPHFEAVDVLPALTGKAVAYLEQRAAAAKNGRPFFLYLPLTAPHTPIAPAKEWQGKSGLNPYADFVMQTDASVGKVLAALDRLGLAPDTLVIFTSDNGCSPEAKFDELRAKGHNPSGQFRGTKADIFEGGHRVPFLARWPGRVQAGTTSGQLICLNDLFATCAEIVRKKLPDNAAEDSVSLLPALEGRAVQPLREALVHHSINGSFAIRQGQWKLALGSDSGGWSVPRPDSPAAKSLPAPQLYDLSSDLAEATNVARAHPELVARLTGLLEKYVADGRSTPGAPQSNTTPVEIRRSTAGTAAKATSLPAPAVAARSGKPNILFLAVDDLKPTLGCYGDRRVQSPAIDRLASRGLLFERAYCNQAVCAPSRNALMTGMRPTSLGIYDLGTNFRLASPDTVSLSQYFIRHGYRAEALGKIYHVGHGNHEDPASWSAPHWKANSIAYLLPESRAKEGLTREEALFANQPADKLPRGAAYESADVPDNEYPDGQIADEAIRRLRAAKEKPGEPFFLAVGFLKPHLPFCAPKKYWDLYDRAGFALATVTNPPAGAPAYAPQFGGELRQYAGIPEKGALDPELQRTLIHGYHAAISYMDAQLGRVLDELDRLNLTTNTVIVLWGDHGWHLGDHGMWCKHSNYEQAARIPLIVSAPGVAKAGTRATNALVETVDIYPTLAELAGLPAPQVPQGIEGKSFVAALRDPDLGTKNCVFHVYPRGERIGRAVRTSQYRLVEWKIPGAAADTADLELYDYVADPLETKNVAASQPEVVSRMRAMLAKLPEAKPQIRAATATAKQKQDRTARFEKKDANHDHKLTREEFLARQPDPAEAPKRFERFDVNKDGVLSRGEFIHMGVPPKP